MVAHKDLLRAPQLNPVLGQAVAQNQQLNQLHGLHRNQVAHQQEMLHQRITTSQTPVDQARGSNQARVTAQTMAMA